jgi:hypothetical protein
MLLRGVVTLTSLARQYPVYDNTVPERRRFDYVGP